MWVWAEVPREKALAVKHNIEGQCRANWPGWDGEDAGAVCLIKPGPGDSPTAKVLTLRGIIPTLGDSPALDAFEKLPWPGDIPVKGLRPYQENAVRAALDAPFGCGILQAPTGSGKTYIALGIAAAAGGRWMYVVHGRDLVQQAREFFTGAREEVPNQIECMGWADARRVVRRRDWEGIIVDEVHQAGSPRRLEVLEGFRGARRVGLSATPLERAKCNAAVVGMLGPVVFSIEPDVLVGGGSLSQGVVRLVTV